jgi:hypothetical protein
MDGETMEIGKRLALVERSMRRYRAAALAALGLIAAAALTGPWLAGAAKTQDLIQARKFELVDDSGTVLAMLSADSDGANLILGDKAGKARAVLSTLGDLAGLAFRDRVGQVRMALFADGDGTNLALSDTAGKPRVMLAAGGDGAGLVLSDTAGKSRAALAAIGDRAALELHDQAGKPRAVLGNYDLENPMTGSTEHRAVSSLVLLDEKGGVLWKAP